MVGELEVVLSPPCGMVTYLRQWFAIYSITVLSPPCGMVTQGGGEERGYFPWF
jgi:hypothetical protein